ncbi:MAG: DUF1585 domain-containing protein, partial [Verrucomicrobiota bacterium]
PPPGVDTTEVESDGGQSRRDIAMKRVENRSCGGCHAKFEPLAFGLEKFDGLGGFSHRDEHGNELREDGEILFPREAKPVPYQSIGELMDLLAENRRVKETITWKLIQFAMGRPLNAHDAAAVAAIHESSAEAGGRYQDIITEFALSDLVTRYETKD